MSQKNHKDNQLTFCYNLSSSQPLREDKKVINFNEYRSKKDTDFFLNTVDYLIKHLHK